MKKYSDFMTSYSSDFALALTVKAVDGSEIRYRSPERGNWGTPFYRGMLRELSVSYMLEWFREIEDEEYRLSSTEEEKKRMETVADGEQLQLETGYSFSRFIYGNWTETFKIEVSGKNGRLGRLPDEIAYPVTKVLNRPGIVLRAIACKPKTSRLCRVKIFAERAEGFQGQLLAADVSDLAGLLTDAIANDEGRNDRKGKERFIAELTEKARDFDRIDKITLIRDYSSGGESAYRVAENDGRLKKLSARLIESEGESRRQALNAMRAYIESSNADRQHPMIHFGRGFEDFRYSCETDDESLLSIAKMICSPYGVRCVEGREYSEINLSEGKTESFAEYDLEPYVQEGQHFSEEELRQGITEQRIRIHEINAKAKDAWFERYGDIIDRDVKIETADRIFVFDGLGSMLYMVDYQELLNTLRENGGIIHGDVTGKTDYLVLIPCNSPDENGIRYAQELQRKGKNIKIIFIDELQKALDS